MDFVQELKDQEQELKKDTRSTVLMDSWEIEHEETPLEVCYQDQFSTTPVENHVYPGQLDFFMKKTPKGLVSDEAVWWVDPIQCADQIIGSLFAFPLVDVVD